MGTVGDGGAQVKRRYDATGRRARAEAARQRILQVAERRFLDEGYAATTIGVIAEDAGVSADTIYKAFGGKPGLIRALIADALRGTGSVPASARSDRVQREERDPREVIRAFGGFVAELTPRAAPLSLLVRDAALSDPELQPLVRDLADSRLRRMTENAHRLHSAGHLRPGVDVGRAATVMWTYSAPELYELLVMSRGLSAVEYGEFVAEAMIAALL